MSVSALLTERERTHGRFTAVAVMSERLRGAMASHENWPLMSPRQREALGMMAVKMARIVCGDPAHADHWTDITGYAVLGAEAAHTPICSMPEPHE